MPDNVAGSSLDLDAMLSGSVAEPEPMFDVKEFLPDSITPAQNGMIPVHLMQKVYCGGQLYIDAARAWTAMVRAAALDKIFLNLNHPLNAYKNLIQQRTLFLTRFEKIASADEVKPDLLRVEFDNAAWQLRADKEFVERPGEMSHGFGLAVFLVNEFNANVRNWLDRNAESFGFIREYDFIPGRFVYIRSREAIPERVLEIEALPPEPRYSASQIIKYSGCKWHRMPDKDWSCNGFFYTEPYRTGAMAVVDQGNGIGVNDKTLEAINAQCSALICTNPTDALLKLHRNLLVSTNIQDTIDKLTDMFKNVAPEETSNKDAENASLKAQLELYRRVNPETAIFQCKKAISQRLLDISIDELKDAPNQTWYTEYLSLLRIRIKNMALCNLGRKYCDELMQWYNARVNDNERELALLGIIQFLDPMELRVPFNEHLWHKDMVSDVRGIFLHQYTKVLRYSNTESDEDIITHCLAQQQKWKHGKRKMRVVFLSHSNDRMEKMIQVFDELKNRDEVDLKLVLHPSHDYLLRDTIWKYFHEKYPDNLICDTNGLFDLRKLKPDYVFYRTPYENRRLFQTFTITDVTRFAKVCNISYGATLTHTFIDRLLDDYPNFYRSLYFMFCSAPTVRDKAAARFKSNVDMGYQHFEFLGYPRVDEDPLPMNAHDKKTILWTPRWSYDARVGGSHFLEYKDNFVALRARYGDKVNLAMRPHENTFNDVQKTNLITKEEIDAYKQSIKDNNITMYYKTFDLNEQFSLTDILLGDYSSILIEYFLTGRPMIYCEFPNAVPFDEYKEMFDCMYIAHNWNEVLHYLDDLVAGNDPLFERRQQAVVNVRAMHANAAKRIADRLLEDFKACEDDSIDEGTVEDERWK